MSPRTSFASISAAGRSRSRCRGSSPRSGRRSASRNVVLLHQQHREPLLLRKTHDDAPDLLDDRRLDALGGLSRISSAGSPSVPGRSRAAAADRRTGRRRGATSSTSAPGNSSYNEAGIASSFFRAAPTFRFSSTVSRGRSRALRHEAQAPRHRACGGRPSRLCPTTRSSPCAPGPGPSGSATAWSCRPRCARAARSPRRPRLEGDAAQDVAAP